MYDDKEVEINAKAVIFLKSIQAALSDGLKHYRKSDDKLLETPKEILEALLTEGRILLVKPLDNTTNKKNKDFT